MTADDYKKALAELNTAFEERKKELVKQYVLSIAKHKVGDIIGDSTRIIKIENIGPYQFYSNDVPTVMYRGLVLTKQFKPRNDASKGMVREENINLVKS